jgi:hypothetical protein
VGAAPALVESLARVGFAVKGIIYLTLGLLALLAGLGQDGRVTDAHGALQTLLARPFGTAIVAALAVGLALYAGWRLLEAFADANRVGAGRRGLGKRAGWALSGALYGMLAVDAASLALRWRSNSDLAVPATITGSRLAPWLIMVIAFVMIGYAALEIRRALAPRFSERLDVGRLSREAGELVVQISRAGIIARAIVMASLAVVLLRARTTPGRAAAGTDMADSLRLVAALPSGDWALTLVAAGLMAYGIYQLVHARYRRITPP